MDADVKALHLTANAMTSGRRSAPVPQLSCVSGCDYQPSSVLCKNEGSDGNDVIWQCTDPNMPNEFEFGSISVTCEGFSYAEDPYV